MVIAEDNNSEGKRKKRERPSVLSKESPAADVMGKRERTAASPDAQRQEKAGKGEEGEGKILSSSNVGL